MSSATNIHGCLKRHTLVVHPGISSINTFAYKYLTTVLYDTTKVKVIVAEASCLTHTHYFGIQDRYSGVIAECNIKCSSRGFIVRKTSEISDC